MGESQISAASATVWINGRRTGTAILVDDRHLLTARHVTMARTRNAGNDDRVKVDISVQFSSWDRRRSVRVVQPVGADAIDLAVLDLGERTSDVAPATLMSGRRLPAQCRVFGFPLAEDRIEGVWRDFTISGVTSRGLQQLSWIESAGTLRGHSGGPVVDVTTGRVIGILVEGSEVGRFDRFAPIPEIRRYWTLLRQPWLRAGSGAGGHSATGERSWRPGFNRPGSLKGRSSVLGAIKMYLEAVTDRPLVITGQPGAGKSAVLSSYARNLEENLELQGVIFHARDATSLELADAIASGVGTDRCTSVDSALEQFSSASSQLKLHILVDSVDEARDGEQRAEICRILTEIAALGWKVIACTRPLEAGEKIVRTSLLNKLRVGKANDPHLVDLDSDRFRDPVAIREHSAELLAGQGPYDCAWETYRDRPDIALRLSSIIAERAEGSFLAAALTSRALAEMDDVIDPHASGFDASLIPTSLNEAIDKYLQTLPIRDQVALRGALTALAHAKGDGFSDQQWIAVANILGYTTSQEFLEGLRASPLVDFLIRTVTEERENLYRLYHQALVDDLKSRRDSIDDRIQIYRSLRSRALRNGSWPTASSADLRHLGEFAQDAGLLHELFSDEMFLMVADLRALSTLIASQDSERVREIGELIRHHTYQLQSLDMHARAGLFALLAAQNGLHKLANWFGKFADVRLEPISGHAASSARFLIGHSGAVRAVAKGIISGRDIVVSGSQDSTVRVWDTNGNPIGKPLVGHKGGVNAVALGILDGREVIVSGAGDSTLKIWDAASRYLIQTLEGHTGWITSVELFESEGSEFVVSASSDSTIRIWDYRGKVVGAPLELHAGVINSVSTGIINGQTVIVSAASDSTIVLSDPGGETIRRYCCDAGGINAAIVGTLEEREVIIGAGNDGTLRIWDAHSMEADSRFVGHAGPVNAVSLAVVDDQDVVVSGSSDATVRVWSDRGETVGTPLVGHRGGVNSVVVGWLNDRYGIVSGSDDESVRILDPLASSMDESMLAHNGWISSLAVGFVGGREVIVTGATDASVRIWDSNCTPIGSPLLGHTSEVNAVALGLLNGVEIIASGARDSSIRLWDSVGLPFGLPILGHSGWVNSVALGDIRGRGVIVSGADDATVRLWDIHGTPLRAPLAGHEDGVNCVALGSLGGRQVIISGASDCKIRIWDAYGEPIGRPLEGHSDSVIAISLGTLDGRSVIVSGAEDGEVRLWDSAGRLMGDPLVGHQSWVSSVGVGVVNGDELVVSCSVDATLRVWDSAGNPIGGPQPLLAAASSVAFGTNFVAVASAASVSVFGARGSQCGVPAGNTGHIRA